MSLTKKGEREQARLVGKKGIDKTCIQNVVNGKQKTAGGYH